MREGEKRSFKSAFRLRPIKSSFTQRWVDPRKNRQKAMRALVARLIFLNDRHLFAVSVVTKKRIPGPCGAAYKFLPRRRK